MNKIFTVINDFSIINPSFLFQTFLLFVFLRHCRTLHYHWLPEEVFKTCLCPLVALQFFYSAVHPCLSKWFLDTQEFSESIFVEVLVPLQFVIVSYIWFFEQLPGLFKRKIFLLGDHKLYLSVSLVLVFAILENGLDVVEIFDELVSLDWADSFNFGCIVAATQDAHIDELLFG